MHIALPGTNGTPHHKAFKFVGSEVAESKQKGSRSDSKMKMECKNMYHNLQKSPLTVKKRGLKWYVTTFNEDHNHPLCEKFELRRFLRSHRGIPEE